MKVLVPSDFSKASNNAALYAAKLAKKIGGELTLFHVVHIESPPMVQISSFVTKKIEDVRVADAEKECSALIKELKSKVKGVQISSKVAVGYPIEDIIEKYALANQVDLIVMGTQGASGLEKILFGSNAVAVINHSSKPVVTVPEHSRFDHLKHIVYASDVHAIRFEIQKIIELAKLFEASIHVLHVQLPGSKKKIDADAFESDLVKKYKYPKISFHLSHSHDVIEGINEFVADVKADMLVMYTQEFGFFDRFLKTSFSREEAFHSLVPLLTFKK